MESSQNNEAAVAPARELFLKFRVNDKKGEGSFGTVWKCVERQSGAEAACKQMRREERVAGEVGCLRRVQGHPHVLGLEGVYGSQTQLSIVTELCNGGDLLQRLQEKGPLGETQARVLFTQVVLAVGHCHRRGVLHRDIKPENVLLHTHPTTGQISARLADFGLATILQKGAVVTGWVGSEPYEAPEVVALQPYDWSADVFSLGVLLHSMLSASWPHFHGHRVFNPHASLSAPAWHSSREARALITRMLSLDPALRPSLVQVLSRPWLRPQPHPEARPLHLSTPARGGHHQTAPSTADISMTSHKASETAVLRHTGSERAQPTCLGRSPGSASTVDGFADSCQPLADISVPQEPLSPTVTLHRTQCEVAEGSVGATASSRESPSGCALDPLSRTEPLCATCPEGIHTQDADVVRPQAQRRLGETIAEASRWPRFQIQSPAWDSVLSPGSAFSWAGSSLSSCSANSDVSELDLGLPALPLL